MFLMSYYYSTRFVKIGVRINIYFVLGHWIAEEVKVFVDFVTELRFDLAAKLRETNIDIRLVRATAVNDLT